MAETATFTLAAKRNPDVLTCIANLSNDEVFTPPEFARRMLDTVAEAWAADHDGADIWADKRVRLYSAAASFLAWPRWASPTAGRNPYLH